MTTTTATNSAATTTTATTHNPRVEVRRAETRGRTDIGWLDSRHSFSFGRYHDAERMGIGPLRVINDDRVAPAGGFDEHPHGDMEILSWIVEGELRHKDSTGAGHTATPGTLQAMSAGSGVRHSEFNPSSSSPVRFLQIWIVPDTQGIPPAYRQHDFSADIAGRLASIAVPTTATDAPEHALRIQQDATVLAGRLGAGDAATHAVRPGRTAYVQVVSGEAAVAGATAREGDAVIVRDASEVEIIATAAVAEVLVFDIQE